MIQPIYYIGHANDGDLRYQASSGGVGSLIIKYLLNENLYGTSITYVFDIPTCRYIPKIIHTSEEINMSGSIYQDIDILSFLKSNLYKVSNGIVITCMPCFVPAVRNLCEKNNIKNFIITFSCSGQTTIEGTYKYYSLMGVNKRDVSLIKYRGDGWPSGIKIFLNNGNVVQKDNYTKPWSLLHRSRLYMPTRCLHCVLHTNIKADMSIADPWIKEFVDNDKIGNTLFTVFTERAHNIISSLQKSNFLCCSRTNEEKYLIAQEPNIYKNEYVHKYKHEIVVISKIMKNKCYFKFATFSSFTICIHIYTMKLIHLYYKLKNYLNPEIRSKSIK